MYSLIARCLACAAKSHHGSRLGQEFDPWSLFDTWMTWVWWLSECVWLPVIVCVARFHAIMVHSSVECLVLDQRFTSDCGLFSRNRGERPAGFYAVVVHAPHMGWVFDPWAGPPCLPRTAAFDHRTLRTVAGVFPGRFVHSSWYTAHLNLWWSNVTVTDLYHCV